MTWRWMLVLALLAPGCDRMAGSAPAVRNPVRNLVFVTIDTLRADHVGALGYGRATTPNIDALALRGAVFTQAIAQSSWTRTSMGSVMTGLYPTTLGLTCAHFRVPESDCDVLPDDVTTLAEAVKASGFHTGGVVANINVDPLFGFHQGFDQYHLALREVSTRREDWRASDDWMSETTREVTDAALDWLADRPDDGRFLLYLHYLDPHHPYDPPGEHADAYDPDDYVGDPSWRDARARYDGEIRHVDEQFARVLAALDEAGLTGTTGIVILSDHGEEFGEHGGEHHGFTLFEEQIHVPLVMVLPGFTEPGTRVRRQVRLLDVMPTVLGALDVPLPPGLQGESLLGRLEGRWGGGRDAPALSERAYNPLVSWREPPWKLIHDTDTGSVLLYDLDRDPGERFDLSAQHPDVVERLRAAALETQEAAVRAGERFGERSGVLELTDDQIEQLRQLGYVDEG